MLELWKLHSTICHWLFRFIILTVNGITEYTYNEWYQFLFQLSSKSVSFAVNISERTVTNFAHWSDDSANLINIIDYYWSFFKHINNECMHTSMNDSASRRRSHRRRRQTWTDFMWRLLLIFFLLHHNYSEQIHFIHLSVCLYPPHRLHSILICSYSIYQAIPDHSVLQILLIRYPHICSIFLLYLIYEILWIYNDNWNN